jgi:predicted TIM-barrel fold metal-dependent hydrolase
VYADVAGLLRQPWRCYNALLNAYEYGVIDKLLFGSDFPHRHPAACIEALYSINQFSSGTNLTAIPREQLRGIVERDALNLLGIEKPQAETRKRNTTTFGDDESA